MRNTSEMRKKWVAATLPRTAGSCCLHDTTTELLCNAGQSATVCVCVCVQGMQTGVEACAVRACVGPAG